jgi:hypothetical protein
MKGTRVVWILIEIHGNILIQAGQSLVALLSVGSDTEGMIVSQIGFIVDECCLVGGREITTLAVVVPTAVEELSLTVRKRLSKFLSSEINIRVEI